MPIDLGDELGDAVLLLTHLLGEPGDRLPEFGVDVRKALLVGLEGLPSPLEVTLETLGQSGRRALTCAQGVGRFVHRSGHGLRRPGDALGGLEGG